MTTAMQEEQHAKQFFKFLEGGMFEITATYPAGKIGTTDEISMLQQKERTRSGQVNTLNLPR